MEQFRLKTQNQTQFKTLTHLQCKRLNSRIASLHSSSQTMSSNTGENPKPINN